MRTRSSAEWTECLESAGIPCGPINTLDEVFDNPQVLAREMKINLPHPDAGQVALVGSPIKLSATPVQYASAPPLLGQHTEQVLRELLHYDEEKIAQLRAQGVIGFSPGKN